LAYFKYKNKQGFDIVNLAATKGLVNVLICLIEKGSDTFSTDAHGNSPLANALLNHHDGVVKYLIE